MEDPTAQRQWGLVEQDHVHLGAGRHLEDVRNPVPEPATLLSTQPGDWQDGDIGVAVGTSAAGRARTEQIGESDRFVRQSARNLPKPLHHDVHEYRVRCYCVSRE